MVGIAASSDSPGSGSSATGGQNVHQYWPPLHRNLLKIWPPQRAIQFAPEPPARTIALIRPSRASEPSLHLRLRTPALWPKTYLPGQQFVALTSLVPQLVQ